MGNEGEEEGRSIGKGQEEKIAEAAIKREERGSQSTKNIPFRSCFFFVMQQGEKAWKGNVPSVEELSGNSKEAMGEKREERLCFHWAAMGHHHPQRETL